MATFTRSIVGIVLLVGLSCMIGCSMLPPGNGKTAAKQSIFSSWQKPKEPERAQETSMHDMLARQKVTKY